MSRGVGFSIGVALFAAVCASARAAQEAGEEMWTGFYGGIVGSYDDADATMCDIGACGAAFPDTGNDGLMAA